MGLDLTPNHGNLEKNTQKNIKKIIKNKNIQIAAFVMTIIKSMVPGWSRMFDELDGILTGNTNDITPVGSLWDALAILGTIACALF